MSTVAGNQVPVNPSNEVVGNVSASPLQMINGVNVVGTELVPLIVTFTGADKQPESISLTTNVYGPGAKLLNTGLAWNTPPLLILY